MIKEVSTSFDMDIGFDLLLKKLSNLPEEFRGSVFKDHYNSEAISLKFEAFLAFKGLLNTLQNKRHQQNFEITEDEASAIEFWLYRLSTIDVGRLRGFDIKTKANLFCRLPVEGAAKMIRAQDAGDMLTRESYSNIGKIVDAALAEEFPKPKEKTGWLSKLFKPCGGCGASSKAGSSNTVEMNYQGILENFPAKIQLSLAVTAVFDAALAMPKSKNQVTSTTKTALGSTLRAICKEMGLVPSSRIEGSIADLCLLGVITPWQSDTYSSHFKGDVHLESVVAGRGKGVVDMTSQVIEHSIPAEGRGNPVRR